MVATVVAMVASDNSDHETRDLCIEVPRAVV